MNAEFIAKLDDCADELIRIKTRIDKDKFDDMVKFLQRYAIIKACGTIETVAKNMIADQVDSDTNVEVQNYITVKVRDSSTNPKTGNISSLLGEFSQSWKTAFDGKINTHTAEKGSLNSLVQLRNDFAHGQSPNTTINTIIRYFEDARIIIELLSETLEN